MLQSFWESLLTRVHGRERVIVFPDLHAKVLDSSSGFTFILRTFWDDRNYIRTALDAQIPPEQAQAVFDRLGVPAENRDTLCPHNTVQIIYTTPSESGPYAEQIVDLGINALAARGFKFDASTSRILNEHIAAFDLAQDKFYSATGSDLRHYVPALKTTAYVLSTGEMADNFRDFVVDGRLHRGYKLLEPAQAA